MSLGVLLHQVGTGDGLGVAVGMDRYEMNAGYAPPPHNITGGMRSTQSVDAGGVYGVAIWMLWDQVSARNGCFMTFGVLDKKLF
jgi:hypothetical protein